PPALRRQHDREGRRADPLPRARLPAALRGRPRHGADRAALCRRELRRGRPARPRLASARSRRCLRDHSAGCRHRRVLPDRARRALNLVGAVATFALGSAWAKAHYMPAHYPSVQAFLLLFFVLFTAIGVLFARRALALGDAPDATRALSLRAAQALAQVGRV